MNLMPLLKSYCHCVIIMINKYYYLEEEVDQSTTKRIHVQCLQACIRGGHPLPHPLLDSYTAMSACSHVQKQVIFNMELKSQSIT